MERETDYVLPFLDVLINNTDPHQSVTTVYQKKNFHRFAHLPLYLQIGVNQTLIHRTFKINNTWLGFNTDLQKLSVILRRNLLTENLINKYFLNNYIQTAVKGGQTQSHSGIEPQETPKFFFKLPYVGHFSVTAQRSIRKLANWSCKPIEYKVSLYYFQSQESF